VVVEQIALNLEVAMLATAQNPKVIVYKTDDFWLLSPSALCSNNWTIIV